MAAKSRKTSAVTSALEALDAEGGSDPDVPVRPGTGTSISVYMHLETKEKMGWVVNPPSSLEPPPETTVIWIPKESDWKLEEDALTKKMYLDIEHATLKGISVEGLVDGTVQEETIVQNATVRDVPAKQVCKENTYYELILHLQKPAE